MSFNIGGIFSNPIAKVGISVIPGGSAIAGGLSALSSLFGGSENNDHYQVESYNGQKLEGRVVNVGGSTEYWYLSNGNRYKLSITDGNQIQDNYGDTVRLSASQLAGIPQGFGSPPTPRSQAIIPVNQSGIGINSATVNPNPTYQSIGGAQVGYSPNGSVTGGSASTPYGTVVTSAMPSWLWLVIVIVGGLFLYSFSKKK
jgi:hypothetical protein